MSIPPKKIDLESITPLNFADLREHVVDQVVINYTPSGYVARMGDQTTALRVARNVATVTMGKLVLTMLVDGTYYHKYVGFTRTTPVSTTFGDRGIAQMKYLGMEPGGRRYEEVLFLNGRLHTQSETLIDHNDQIIWSRATDREGTTLVLSRK